MIAYTLGFQQIDKAMPATVGGKGANLAQLCRIEGITVPPGFCVTTEAFKEAISSSEQLTELLEELDV